MTSRYLRALHGATAALLLWTLGMATVQAQVDPVAELFRAPKLSTATLSPNGKYLATTSVINGRSQLGVIDIASAEAKTIAGYPHVHIVNVRWISDDRLVFSIVDTESDFTSSAGGLYAIDRQGQKMTVLMISSLHIRGVLTYEEWASEPRWLKMISRGVVDDKGNIIAVGYFPNGDARLFRVDTTNGRRSELDFSVEGIPRSFVLDSHNELRVVVTSNTDHSIETIWLRDAGVPQWRRLHTQPAMRQSFEVLGFSDADMIVSAPTGKGLSGIYKFDFSKNAPGDLLVADSLVDVDDHLIFAPDSGKLLGVRVESEPPRTVWFDAAMQKLQDSLNNGMPGLVHDIDPGKGGAPMLVHSYSSTEPGRYALYYPDTRKVIRYLSRRPWIDPRQMAPKLVYDYQARDGLPMMGYLTLPSGRAARLLPLVLLVHGGPWSRDHWQFDPAVQMLAGMGYAVLQPQFRGSTGFGDQHLRKSFGQWGLAMQDDLSDGVQSLVKQGVVDASRVCIMGASYGGYAAMMGLVKNPGEFRCAINLLGVTNLFHHSSQGRSPTPEARYSLDHMLGNPKELQEQFARTSPSLQAQRIQAPAYMVYGEKDTRVPRVHGIEMRDAMEKAGKVFEFTMLDMEEHGLADEATRIGVYRGIARFLTKYNPAHPEEKSPVPAKTTP